MSNEAENPRNRRRRGDGSARPRAEGRPNGESRESRAPRTERQPRTDRPQRDPRPRGPKPLTADQLAARRAALPVITYPEELPVSARREDIKEAIEKSQVVIVAGETGSGKTTQLPKILLELGRGITGMIGHTQPRRIAARSVAERISAELGVELGGAIGYQVRFTEEVSPTTLVKLMTDGILLAEVQSDPQLLRYDTIVIDEAHERSLNIDFLLGYLAQLLPQRPDLKVIITSATIDSQRFAEHFGRHMYGGFPGTVAPIVEVSGRTYPVEIRYRPLTTSSENDDDETTGSSGTASREDAADYLSREESIDQVTGIIEAAEELMNEGPGDILVFLSGEGDIKETERGFEEELGRRYVAPGQTSTVPGAIEVLPLYARLSAAEQHRIFQPHRHRRIILATNIAETSLTVPGIRYVIDPGTARISRFSNKTKVQRLPIEKVSQASANQRSGRCGRVADGIAIRLYSEADFERRDEFTEPEILRTSLASVILQMAALGLGAVADFPFIDPPDLRAVRAGEQLLEEIGALSAEPETRRGRPASSTDDETWRGSDGTSARKQPQLHLTRMGRQLARLPIDPRLGRMLLAAADNGCASEVLVLVAALSVQDVRERPTERRPQADQLHARFTDQHSDFLAYLNLWRYLRTQQRELSGSAFRRMCKDEYLNWLRFREWQDVVTQLRQLAKPLGLTLHPIALPTHAQIRAEAEPGKDVSHHQDVSRAVKVLGASRDTPASDAIHRSLLVGLLSNLGQWDERKRDYEGARGTHFVIWPGSGLHRRSPQWVMAAELVETSRLFARTVARIDPVWIERVGKHLVKKVYSEPYWSSRQGAAMVHEKITLYGMTVVADRTVLLATAGTPSSKDLARELFIRHGLVDGDWRAHHDFIKRNREAVAEAEETESRLRSRGLIADDAVRFAFFDERVPAEVVSGRHFDSWWKKARQASPELLDYTQEFLLGETSVSDADFPAEWVQGDITLPIDYAFSPGKHSDGLTIDVPVTLLPQLTEDGFDWLVPGMLDDLVVSTIRALPKRVRRGLVPAPDVARQIQATLPDWDSVAHGQPGAPSFREAFTKAALDRGVEIDAAAWAETNLPPHLEITFRVRSERGAVLDEGPSLTMLQRALAPQTRTAVESVVKGAVAKALDDARNRIVADAAAEADVVARAQAGAARAAVDAANRRTAAESLVSGGTSGGSAIGAADDLQTWPALANGTLPNVVETPGPNGMVVRGYPALVADAGKDGRVKVSLRVLAEPAEQTRDHRLGVINLVAREAALPEGRVTSRWTGSESLSLAASPYKTTSGLVADLQLAATRNLADAWAKEQKLPLGQLRTERDYTELRDAVRERLEDEVYRIARITARILQVYGETESAIRTNSSIALIGTVTDVRDQVSALIRPGFISGTPQQWFDHLPRYLAAATHRIAKAAGNPAADDALAWQATDVEDFIAEERAAAASAAFSPATAAALEQARWMVEELRVSLFAQQLGTPMKVSAQRIRKLFG